MPAAPASVEVPLREENNFLVDNLERMLGKKRKVAPNALFGRATLAAGRLKLFPYTAIFNQAVVLQDRGAPHPAVAQPAVGLPAGLVRGQDEGLRGHEVADEHQAAFRAGR